MKTKLLFIISLIACTCMHAQVRWSKDLFPSPMAASLMQYIDMPVSHYTGVPNISIPLYTIEVSGYELPISLSYHASGIKVAQEASLVGLGWALNAGGVVTRTVRCKDDFDSSSGYLYDNLIVPGNPGESAYSDYVGIHLPGGEVMIADGEPDLFYYNFAGFQGQFIFNKKRVNNKVICEAFSLNPQDNLQIKLIPSSPNGYPGFRLIDTNGVEYTFSTVELKKSYSDGDVTTELSCPITIGADDPDPEYNDWEEEYISSWYLTSIKLPNNDTIAFSYEYNEKAYNGPTFYTYEANTFLYQDGSDELGPHNVSTTFSNKEAEVLSPVLSTISWPLGSMQFETNDRIDIRSWGFVNNKAPQKLDYILVSPRYSNTSLQVYFSTSYFGADVARDKNYLYKRLRLDGVSILESETGESQNYTFGYDERYNLPAKNGATDLWGYYITKSRSSNGHLCTGKNDNNPPGISAFTVPKDFTTYSNKLDREVVILSQGRYFFGEDRSCDPERVSTYTLNRITYPTGGNRKLYYEPNQTKEPTFGSSRLGGGIRIKQIVSSDKTETFTYEENGVSTGVMVNKPQISNFLRIMGLYHTDYYLVLSSASYTSAESTVGYSKVRVNTVGRYYEDYYFRNFPLPKERNFNYPNQKRADNGLLEKKIYYAEQTNKKIKEELYQYAFGNSSSIATVTAMRLYGAAASGLPYYSLSNEFYNMSYKRVFENNYDNPEKMVAITENFTYYPNTAYIKQKTYNNRKTDISYSFNLNTPTYTGMTERNIIVPIEEILSVDNRIAAGTLTDYKLTKGLYLPAKVCVMQLPRDSSFAIVSSTWPQQLPTQIRMYDGVVKSNRYRDDLIFHAYDPYGNPTLIEDKSGLYTVVKWDFEHQYPVLQIINPYQELIDNIRANNTYVNNLTPSTLKTGDQYDDMEVNVYDYSPLKGVKSITNTRKQTTGYDFDMMGRLRDIYYNFTPSQRIKARSYEYHYQYNF